LTFGRIGYILLVAMKSMEAWLMYKWDGMQKVTYEEALDRFPNKVVYLLYDDNTEALVNEELDIHKHWKANGEFGYKKRNVTVAPYNEEWPRLYEAEAHKLKKVYGDEVIEIYHIGSTSVPGLSAKPIIDMMPIVKDISKVDDYNQAMMEIGYEPRGENGIVGRRYFQKGNEKRTHHVHIYEEGSQEIERHIAFRDYLQADPEMVLRYGTLKEELVKLYPYDIDSYIREKGKLVKEIEEKALIWYKETIE
jgi:GrpB-like predicted nucleotidyltransferase (UPF0157 family)